MEQAQLDDVREQALDWMEMIDRIGPFAPMSQLQQIYDQAPQEISQTGEYWYVSGLIQGRQGYKPLPDGRISADEHIEILDHIAKKPEIYGMQMAEQAGGLRDGYMISLGWFGDPKSEGE